jgi:hypothetical protein
MHCIAAPTSDIVKTVSLLPPAKAPKALPDAHSRESTRARKSEPHPRAKVSGRLTGAIWRSRSLTPFRYRGISQHLIANASSKEALPRNRDLGRPLQNPEAPNPT